MKKKNIKKNKIINLLSSQHGIALLTTLIFIFILVTYGVTLLSMTSNDIKLSALQRDSTKAFYIAESGIEKALWYLNTKDLGGKGFGWQTDTDEDPNEYIQETYPAESTNYYQVTVKDTTDPDKDIIIITSRGVISDGNKVYRSRKIEVKAEKVILPFNMSYNYAISTDTLLELKGNLGIIGDIHSNGSIEVAGFAYILDGYSYAVGANEAVGKDGENHSGEQYYEEHPKVILSFYKDLSQNPKYSGKFYDILGGTKYFNTDGQEISGIHFIDGNVEISANTHLIINGGAIFATGTITSKGNAQITHKRRLKNIHTNTIIDCTETDPLPPCPPCDENDRSYNPFYDEDSDYYDPLCNNPFALVAIGDINLSGKVDTQGIIQTSGEFRSNGNIFINPGAIIADHGIFHGSGEEDVMNVVWPEEQTHIIVPGTGKPSYIKISWQEK